MKIFLIKFPVNLPNGSSEGVPVRGKDREGGRNRTRKVFPVQGEAEFPPTNRPPSVSPGQERRTQSPTLLLP